MSSPKSSSHPEAEVLCEKDFWRQKYKHQDESPEGRCC
ncbi:MAG TPA: YbdD/YjiX family protein [Enteractinococcus helveticum]|uniref:YbdD/YjiX family protein n=1 Tax=Enteractinococcus helveticum TaxID=1837282 RepID=A0A921K756_9MICC|nr:YbdD/YjiX family protein [Enteractinococcus helveticum]